MYTVLLIQLRIDNTQCVPHTLLQLIPARWSKIRYILIQGKNLSNVNVDRQVGGSPNVNQCKQRWVGGQKFAKFANVVCERPLGIIRIGKITLSAKGITDEITDNHLIYICSVHEWLFQQFPFFFFVNIQALFFYSSEPLYI